MAPKDIKVLEASSTDELTRQIKEMGHLWGYQRDGSVVIDKDKDGRTIYKQAMVML